MLWLTACANPSWTARIVLNGKELCGWSDPKWSWKASLVSWDNSEDVLLFLSALVGSKRCARQEHACNICWAMHLVGKDLADSCRALVNSQSLFCTHSQNYKCLWAVPWEPGKNSNTSLLFEFFRSVSFIVQCLCYKRVPFQNISSLSTDDRS